MSEEFENNQEPIAECVRYMKVLVEMERVKTVPEMLDNAAYVYLGRKDRVLLALSILKTIFR